MARYVKKGLFVMPEHGRGAFDTEDAYLNEVYRLNINKMNEAGVSLDQFKYRVEGIKLDDGLRVDQALKNYSRSRLFLSSEEVKLLDIQNSGVIRDLKGKLRDQGELISEQYIDKNGKLRNRKTIDWSSFTWDAQDQRFYSKNRKVYIEYTYAEDSSAEAWYTAGVV